MPTNPLTPEEATKLKEGIRQRLLYMTEVCEALKRRGYGPADHLWREAHAARAKMQDCFMAAHYEACAGGVGKDPSQD